MKKNYALLLFLITFQTLSLVSQNEGKIWYFGLQAGLDFGTSPPTALTNGVINTSEGCATICDGAGNLLFYTDGISVWDKTHQSMNVTMYGDGSSTQSGIIVKQPGSSTLYYIFTCAAYGSTLGINYSIVDMTLNGGLGLVTTTNVSVYPNSCEKVTAVKHCNGTDAWIVSHEIGSNTFRSYLLTSTGLSSTPVLSSVGTIIPSGSVRVLGQMKISPNGKTLGLAIYDTNTPAPAELYDFDPSTGVVSNQVVLDNFLNAYGAEFSGDGTKFYVSQLYPALVHQWAICAGNATAMAASHYSVGGSTAQPLGSLQLAMDGKIYVARDGAPYIGVINAPNLSGSAINYQDNAITLAGKTSEYGLPNFINSYFSNSGPFTYTPGCLSATFTPPSAGSSTAAGCTIVTNSIQGVEWDFGDPASASQNSSTVMNPTHSYTATGTYTVKLTVHYQCSSTVQQQTIQITSGAPVLSLSGNYSICAGNSTTLSATGAVTYSWSNGSQSNSVVVTPNANAQYVVYGWGSDKSCSTYSIINVKVDKCTGIDEQTSQALRVFPNPTSGLLEITHQEAVHVTVQDIYGKTILSTDMATTENVLDLSTCENGMYFIRVNDGKQLKIYRIQKSN